MPRLNRPERCMQCGGGAFLTDREMEVVRGIVAGKGNKEIAYDLHISEKTVKNYAYHIMQALGVTNRTAVAVHALKHELVPMPREGTGPMRRAS